MGTCSNGYDKVRGNCHCQTEFWGGGCEFKKCPGGAVPQSPEQATLYPSTSSNACAGRGACSDETGKCSCPWPFRGNQCELRTAPATAAPLALRRAGQTQESASAKHLHG